MAQPRNPEAPGRARAATPTLPPAPATPADQGEMTVADLARGVLARELKPRTADVRRLAEAVLAKKAKKKAGAKSAGKKARKLAKIPGQRKK